MIKNSQHNAAQLEQFRALVWQFYREHGRQFMWRHAGDPYHIVVSEIMLQQTQTYRVEPKFEQFIGAFPNFHALADAPLRDVLGAWQGLGYNRRGIYLQRIAQKVMNECNGVLPNSPEILETFPGIGHATARSICAFAFNSPVVFIETNIRAVFLHYFFHDATNVHDKELLPLIEKTLDHENPREWYYALMDLGVHLKKTFKNPSRKSAHHTTQSKFEGSDRQIRGMIIKLLTEHKHIKRDEIPVIIKKESKRVERILHDLHQEKFITFYADDLVAISEL